MKQFKLVSEVCTVNLYECPESKITTRNMECWYKSIWSLLACSSKSLQSTKLLDSLNYQKFKSFLKLKLLTPYLPTIIFITKSKRSKSLNLLLNGTGMANYLGCKLIKPLSSHSYELWQRKTWNKNRLNHVITIAILSRFRS